MKLNMNFWMVVFTLFLCEGVNAQDKVKVVSSASIFQNMAAVIGGDKVESVSIVPIGGDPHLYDPKPSDPQLVQSADVVFINGLTFEGWVNKVIENSGTKAKVYTITEGIEPIQSDQYQNAPDPHAWMDLTNGLTYIKNIKDALVKVDAGNAAYYKKNYETYKSEIERMNEYILKEVQKIPNEQRMLVTSHDAFAYYGRKYGIKLNALKGISTEAETQTSDMVRVARAIRESGVPAIFIESTINPKVIQQIAKDNGVQIGGELFADSLGEPEEDSGTYLGMLKHNTDVIVKALSANEMSETKINTDDSSNKWWLYGIVGFVMIGGLLLLISRFNK